MSVELDPPSQLVFKRPLTQPIEEFLVVKNVGTEPMAFKVKTTAPKQYCVRPNSGRIEANGQVEVQVIFQPFKEEPAPDFKCKDKFLVQTAVIKPDWMDLNMMELWTFIETEHRESLSQRKVKCVFLPPELPEPVETLAVNDVSDSLSVQEEGKDKTETTPSPTLSSTLPAIIDAANKSSRNKLYDPTASSTSLLTAHTTAPLIKPSTPSQPPLTDARLVQKLADEKERLEQDLNQARSNEKRLQDQVLIQQQELARAVKQSDELQQQIKTLKATTCNISSVDGYPPQVLLLVSALVFVFTFLFF